jgi:hypothetical protein
MEIFPRSQGKLACCSLIIGGIIAGRSPTHAFRQATSIGGASKQKTMFTSLQLCSVPFSINTITSVFLFSLCAIAQYEINIFPDK